MRALAFSPDGKTLAMGTGEPESPEGASLQLVDVSSGKRQRDFAVEGAVSWVSFLADGKELASVEAHRTQFGIREDGTALIDADQDVLRYWDCSTGRLRDMQRVDFGGDPAVLAVSPDGGTAFVRAGDSEYLWDTRARRTRRTLPTMTYGHSGQRKSAHRAVFSPSGRYLAACGRRGEGPVGAYMLFDVRSSRLVRMVPTSWDTDEAQHQAAREFLDDSCRARDAKAVALEGPVTEVAFSLDGRLLASTGWRVAVRDTATGHLRHLLNVEAHGAAFLADGHLLALEVDIVDNPRGPDLRLYDLTQRKCVKRWRAHNASIDAMVASPDGTRLATGGEDQTVKLWRLADMEPGS